MFILAVLLGIAFIYLFIRMKSFHIFMLGAEFSVSFA